MSGRIKTVIGVTAYLLACSIALWKWGVAALALVMIATFGGAMIYKAEADDAVELADELLRQHDNLLNNIKSGTDRLMTLNDVRQMLEGEEDDE